MSSTKKYLIEVRSNTNFNVNYDTKSLQPQVELILLMQRPEYKLCTKAKQQFIEKSWALNEFRCMTTLDGINALIGQLQHIAAGLQQFEHMAVGLNMVIEQAKQSKPEQDK